MTSHELARQLLELPEDTRIIYYEDAKSPFATTVENFISVKSNAADPNPEERAAKGQASIPSTYLILNPRN